MTASHQRQPTDRALSAPGTGRLVWSQMPLRGPLARDWTIALASITAVSVLVGMLIVGPLDTSVGQFDRSVSAALGNMRTSIWNDWTALGSASADSLVKIPAVVILVGVFLWRWKRWQEAVLLAGSLIFESSSFVIASFIVGRDRPAIEQLDSIPPTGSFPSGHTAAAVAFYGALAVIVFWRTTRPLPRSLAAFVAFIMPPIVGLSRTYRGMHFFSDVVFGSLVGLASLLVMVHLLTSGVSSSHADGVRTARSNVTTVEPTP